MERMSAVQEHLGPYEIVRALAVGGQAEVLLGELRGPGGFQVRHALKVQRQRLQGQDPAQVPEARALIAEARLLARLTHPNTLAIHGLHVFEDRLTMVLEYVAGRSLATVLGRLEQRGEVTPPGCALWITCDVLRALDRAHHLSDEQGRPLHVVHRDVTPQNVLLGYNGRCKLIDFGIAISRISSRDTRLGIVKGKLDYMSPEQAYAMGDVDHRTDLYTLGLVLYQMLTGLSPLAGDPSQALQRAREPEILPVLEAAPRTPEALAHILDRALARDPEDRYPDARHMLRDCVRLLHTLHPDWCGDEPVTWLRGVLREEQRHERHHERRQGTQVIPAPEAIAPPPPRDATLHDLLPLTEEEDLPPTLAGQPEAPSPVQATSGPSASDDEDLDLGELLQAIEDIYDRRSGVAPAGERKDATRLYKRLPESQDP